MFRGPQLDTQPELQGYFRPTPTSVLPFQNTEKGSTYVNRRLQKAADYDYFTYEPSGTELMRQSQELFNLEVATGDDPFNPRLYFRNNPHADLARGYNMGPLKDALGIPRETASNPWDPKYARRMRRL